MTVIYWTYLDWL